ncbi:MAG: phage tail tape measure protein [Capnocytophaga sp.]|nr:tape measure protein [Capnocytophaga sp.]MBB1568343.1 phage tail tape measure protein [Capnocytophaga sp.]
MQPQDGALLFQVRADQSQIQKDVEAIKKQFEQMTRKAVEEGKKQADVWQTLLKGATAYFTLQGAQSFISQMVAVRSEFQQLEISFGTMLKSKEKANALMAQMTDLAAKTPFGLQEVSEGAKRLLAFQVPAEEVTETLRRMGDVAAGLGVPMGQLIHVYGQVKAQGKLMTNDLYQFMNAGIPIIAELSKVVGKSETEIKDMVSAGKIGFPEVQAVIKNMTSEGGLFFNLMAEQSKSLGGQISNLQDNFDQMLNEIGKASEGAVSGAISSVSYLVENYQTLGKLIAGLVATYGTYKAAIIVNNTLIALSTQLTNGWTVAQLAQYRGLLLLEKAQKLLNATMLANPYIFMATAVAALGAAMFILTDRTSAAEKAQKRLNEEREVAMAKEQEHKQHIEELIDSATNQYLADTDRRKALTELAGAYPQIFAKYDIESIKLADILKLKKEIAEFDANKARGQRQTDYSKNKEYAKILYDIGTKQGSKGFDEIAKGSDLDRIITEKFGNHWRTFGNYSDIYAYFNEKQKNAKKELKSDALTDWTANLKNQSEDELKKQLEQRKRLIADLQNQEKEGKKWASHGVKFGEEWYAFNKEELQAQNQAIQAQLDHLHEKTYSYTDLSKKYATAVKNAEKALADITSNKAGYKTETDYQKAVSEAKENLKQAKKVYDDFTVKPSKTKNEKTKTEFDTEKANRDHQRQIQDDLFRQEEARIKIMQDGTDKRLAIIQLEYDKQEEEIRRRSQDQLAAFIETKKAEAEAAGKWKKGQDFDTNTEAINAEKARLAENEKNLLASNAEYQRMQQEQVYKELLEKYQTYTDQRKAIEEKYNADIATLQAKLGADAPQVKKAQDEKARELKKLDILYKKEGTAIAKLFDNLRKKTVKEIRETILEAEKEIDALASTLDMGDNANVEFIKNLRQQIEQVRDTAERSDTVFGRLGKNIQALFKFKPNTIEWKEALQGVLSDAQSITSEFAQLGQEFERLGQSTGNESLKRIGQTMQNVSNVLNRTASFAQMGSAAGPWGAAIGAAVGLLTSGFESAAKARMEHEKKLQEIANSKINQQSEYNRLLYEERMLHKENTSVFGTKEVATALGYLKEYKTQWDSLQKDITSGLSKERRDYLKGQTEKGFNPFSKSSQKEWLKNRNELVAKQSKLENIKVADGSYTTGILWWKKSHTIWKSIIDVHPKLIKANGELDADLAKSIVKYGEFGESGKQALQDIIDSYERAQESQKKFEDYIQSTFGELGKDITNSVYTALQNGEDAFESFAKSVGNIIGKLGKQMVYELYVADAFKDLQEKLKDAGKRNGGDSEGFARQSSQLVGDFSNAMKGKIGEMQEFLKKWNAMSSGLGFDFLNEQRKATEKGYMRMSQDTGDELLGQFRLQTQLSAEIKNAALQTANFIREMHQSMQVSSAKQLQHLAGIETNTYKLHKMETDLAGVKRGIDELTTKGIKMRT